MLHVLLVSTTRGLLNNPRLRSPANRQGLFPHPEQSPEVKRDREEVVEKALTASSRVAALRQAQGRLRRPPTCLILSSGEAAYRRFDPTGEGGPGARRSTPLVPRYGPCGPTRDEEVSYLPRFCLSSGFPRIGGEGEAAVYPPASANGFRQSFPPRSALIAGMTIKGRLHE